jgi:hypothetical protein
MLLENFLSVSAALLEFFFEYVVGTVGAGGKCG